MIHPVQGPYSFRPYTSSDAELKKLRELDMKPVRLLTNNGDAVITVDGCGLAHVMPTTRPKRGDGFRHADDTRDATAALMAASWDMRAALARLAKYPSERGDELSAESMRQIAREALAKSEWNGLP